MALDRQDLSRVRLMHVNYPNNPTAATATPDFFERLAAFGRAHHILICHDNAYSEVYFDGHRPPSFLQAADGTRTGVSSLLQDLHDRWRIGVAVGNARPSPPWAPKSNYETGIFPVVSTPIAALSGDPTLLDDMRMRQQRRDLFVDGLRRLGFSGKPAATFTSGRHPRRRGPGPFCRRCWTRPIVVTPGAGFGPHG
jgi:LL-diaminopimelate aminotransferase